MDSQDTLPGEMPALIEYAMKEAAVASSLESLQEKIVRAIGERLPYYDWTGFYMLDPDDPKTLVLGPFDGAPTPHVRIPVSQGICGAAVESGETVVVDDVNADPRYLSCSISTNPRLSFLSMRPAGWWERSISTATNPRPSPIGTGRSSNRWHASSALTSKGCRRGTQVRQHRGGLTHQIDCRDGGSDIRRSRARYYSAYSDRRACIGSTEAARRAGRNAAAAAESRNRLVTIRMTSGSTACVS
jgi:hypothetical protein